MELISHELEQKIIAFIKQKRMIEAVMLVKTELNLGLKESKDLVDKYRAMYEE